MLFLINNIAMGQNVVFKTNNLTGQIEAFNSLSGQPTGTPLYKIKKNIWGYLEIEGTEQNMDPYSKKPDYEFLKQRQPYNLNLKEIIETLEILNYEREFQNIQSGNKSTFKQLKESDIQNYFASKTKIAEQILSFYNKVKTFPKNLKDGWYNIVRIIETPEIKTLGIPKSTIYHYGISLIKNNTIIEIFENIHALDIQSEGIFRKIPLEYAGQVQDCQGFFKEKGTNEYGTIYFMDNLINYDAQCEAPNFGFFTVYTSGFTDNGNIFQFKDNENMTEQDIRDLTCLFSAYISSPNPNNNNCSNTNATFAFRNSNGKFYSIGIINTASKKTLIKNNVSISPGLCNSLIFSR